MAQERAVDASAREGEQPDPEGAASLDQVRDLLFGTQMRESQKRFARLEERFGQELGDLRADTKKRLDALEAFFKIELQGLAKRVQDERAERGAELQRLGRDLADSVAQLGRRVDDQRAESARSASELHQGLLAQSKALGDDFVTRLGEHSATTQAELRGLRSSVVDRAALSALLAQLALQLSDDEHPPG